MTIKDLIGTERFSLSVGSTASGVFGSLATVASSGPRYAGSTAVQPRSARTIFIPADEVYRWTLNWRQGEARSREALARGDYVEFSGDDPAAIERFLLSDH